jgi:hypothetical protein
MIGVDWERSCDLSTHVIFILSRPSPDESRGRLLDSISALSFSLNSIHHIVNCCKMTRMLLSILLIFGGCKFRPCLFFFRQPVTYPRRHCTVQFIGTGFHPMSSNSPRFKERHNHTVPAEVCPPLKNSPTVSKPSL